MYKIRYFLTVKYFMKYFGNISVFFEIFQNVVPDLLLPHDTNLVMINTCNYLLLRWKWTTFYIQHPRTKTSSNVMMSIGLSNVLYLCFHSPHFCYWFLWLTTTEYIRMCPSIWKSTVSRVLSYYEFLATDVNPEKWYKSTKISCHLTKLLIFQSSPYFQIRK
jgi:hypothetical protein